MSKVTLNFYDHFKAAINQALSVKRHGAYIRFQPWIGHDFLHSLVSYIARRPDDPGKNDCLIILTLDRHGKRRELPVGYVISPALNKFQCAMLLEDYGGGSCMLLVDFTIGSGNSGNKSINIGHDISPSFNARTLPQRSQIFTSTLGTPAKGQQRVVGLIQSMQPGTTMGSCWDLLSRG